MQSTNAKGYRSDLKSGESPSPFRFTPGYMRTTYTHKNLERENHEMGNREEMDPSDSINGRSFINFELSKYICLIKLIFIFYFKISRNFTSLHSL